MTQSDELKQSVDELKKATGSLVFEVLESFAFAILSAYTISLMWRWFAVPLGLPPLGMAHAFGLAMLARLMTASTTTIGSMIAIKEKLGIEEKPFWKRFATFLMLQVIVIAIAWVARLFM